MEKYIVKVQSLYKNECVEYGTGIMIARNLVLTPKHVVCTDLHRVWIDDQEYQARIVKENNVAVVLEISHFNDTFSMAAVFSEEEILDEESTWSVDGFITSLQHEHHVSGTGIIVLPTKDAEWDYHLASIATGMADNYQGLSGSPVFCDNRIVGILQMQAHNSNGALGICISSVKMFRDLLVKDNFKPNAYLVQLREALTQYSQSQIEKNVRSKKYIPDIFVEEGDYKESLRYFADPVLFLKKAIRDVKILDFSGVNFHLRKNGEQEIDFFSLADDFLATDLEKTYAFLQSRISDALSSLEKLEKSNNSGNSSLEHYYYTRQNSLNNSVKYYLSEIQENINYIGKKYLLLTKDAGQGKTNFICDFALNFVIRKSFFALYFNAYDFRENPMTLIKQQLSLNGMCSFVYANKILLREWASFKRSIIIFIDGLNENTLVPDFGQCIRDFLEECQAFPYIKVIMTTRNEFLQERFVAIEEGTYSIIYKHINMCQRGDDFKGRIFWGYLNFFDITIRENTLTEKFYDALTNDVLLLRFFCEVNEHKKQIYVYDVYKYNVFRQYLNLKSQEYRKGQQVLNPQDSLNVLLDKIAEYMIREKTFFNVPSGIFNEDEQKLLYQMLDNEVIFKDEQIIKTGMLPRNTVVISFTFDEFRDFCITNYILTHLAERLTFLSFWNQMNTENLTIRGGVQKYIFYLARTESQEDLLPILKDLPEYENLYWLYIWGLEDCHFTAQDKEAWKMQLITNGHQAEKIVHDLIGKSDCEFFGNINIRLLFEALDVLAEKIDLYDAFIKRMFGVYRQKKGIDANPRPESVWPFNRMIRVIEEYVNDDSWNVRHSECYRLVIYLLELENRGALDLWRKLYGVSPEMSVRILGEMNRHKCSLILCNVKEVLYHIGKNRNGDAYDLIIERLAQENSFCRDISIDRELFSKLVLE